MENVPQPEPASTHPLPSEPKTGRAWLLLASIILLALAALAMKLSWSREGEPAASESRQGEVVLAATQMVGGLLPPPPGFPTDIPLEDGGVVESFTTHFDEPGERRLLSVSYQSSKSVAEKYAEYQSYLNEASYAVSPGPNNNGVKALFGTGTDSDISVVVSSPNGRTLVQLAYLIK